MREVRSQKSEVRRVLFLTFLTLSFVFSAFAQDGGQPTQSQADLISDFDVNGLKVIVKRRPNAPTIAAGLFVRGGVRNLTANTAGIENLMLATAVEASKKYPRAAMRKELTKMASTLGASANEDFSVVSLNSTRPNFDKTWDIFTDAVMNPAFAQADFELVRERILTGLRNESVSPDSALDALQDKIIYANHPYSNSPNGTVETIGAFKLADVRAYHQKAMTTSQLLLVVVGDVDPAALQKQVAATLGKLPKGDYKETALPQLTFDKPSLDITSRAVETNYVKGIFAAPSLTNPDYYAMRVAMTLLQAKVIQEVRNNRQLSYAPNAEMDDDAANSANIYVTADNDKANEAVAVMLDEIEKMRGQGVGAEEFTGLPGFFLTTYFLKQETNASQVAELARYELVGGGWRNSLDFISKMLAVKPQDVKTVADKYMKNIRFVVIGNPSAIKKQILVPN